MLRIMYIHLHVSFAGEGETRLRNFCLSINGCQYADVYCTIFHRKTNAYIFVELVLFVLYMHEKMICYFELSYEL